MQLSFFKISSQAISRKSTRLQLGGELGGQLGSQLAGQPDAHHHMIRGIEANTYLVFDVHLTAARFRE